MCMASRHSGPLVVLSWFFAALVCAAAQTNAPPPAALRHTSIVLILADELGWGDLGCYGQKRILTPRINGLAAVGMRFTDCYAGAGEDRDARAALMIGATPGSGSPDQLPTLAEQLKAAGYHTGYIGYWGLGGFESPDAAHRRGFEEVVAYDSRAHANDLYTDHLYRRDPHTGFEGRVPLVKNQAHKMGEYLPDLLTQAAVRFCRQNKPELLNHFRPFFLVVSYPVPTAVGTRSGPIPETPAYAGQGWPELQSARANAITRFDQHVGELLDELDKRGMSQHTLVLLTSSLGPDPKRPPDPAFFESAGRFRLDAGELSEGRLRVPLVVRWPFWMRSGKVSDLSVSGQDIPATVLEVARLEQPAGLPGISFLPTLQGLEQTHRHSSLQWTIMTADGARQRAVRQGKWKLLDRGGGQPAELYDCASDPHEATNVAGQNPDVIRDLLKHLSPPATGAPPGH